MKILVYGAGTLGSLCAARLQQAGWEVTLLGRGQRLAELREHGVVLEEYFTKEREAAPVPVVEALGPDDAYDWVIVIVGRAQAPTVLPALAANHVTPNVLFMGNWAAGPEELTRALGRERVLLGFVMAAGTRLGHVVSYSQGPAGKPGECPIGELDGQLSDRLRQIVAIFEKAGMPVSIQTNIDAYLKYHAALVWPLYAGLYLADLDLGRLAKTRDAQLLVGRAWRECFKVLAAHGLPVTPRALALFRWMPEPLLVRIAPKRLTSPGMGLGFAHAHGALAEFQALGEDLYALARQTKLATPNLDRLYTVLATQAAPLPEGSASLAVDYRPVWAGLLAAGGLALGLAALVAWLSRRR
jgi:2-dehydropantoate 2-reductase